MTLSAEADLLVVTAHPADVDRLATLVDGTIGEASLVHQTHGYYGQGVGPESATLPSGWVKRLVPIRDHSSGAVAFCLDAHDLCAAKLSASRPKDLDYVGAALRQRLVDGTTIREGLQTIQTPPARRAEISLARIDTNPMNDAERTKWRRNRERALNDRRSGAGTDARRVRTSSRPASAIMPNPAIPAHSLVTTPVNACVARAESGRRSVPRDLMGP